MSVEEEFVAYKQAVTQNPTNLSLDCYINGEIHRFHYLGDKRAFMAVLTNEGGFVRFIPKLSFH